MTSETSLRRPVATWVAFALIVVLASAGSAVAATLVTSKQIKNHTIKMIDINSKTVKNLQYSKVPSGTTVRGVWGGLLLPGDSNNNFFLDFVSLPLPLPTALKDAKVKFGTKGANGSTSSAIALAVKDDDESSLCAGTFLNPTAPRGMLCIYVRDDFGPWNVSAASLSTDPPAPDTTPGPNKYGFVVGWAADNLTVPARTEGTWAYTAP